jgi:uncharacterized protein YfeS
MEYRLISPVFSGLLLFILNFPAKSQDSSIKFEFSPQTAHPNAQTLMKEDFFWSPIDDVGPFGSDGGSDAAYGYYHWQKTHAGLSPLTYLKSLISSWKYPEIAWDEMDTAKIEKYMSITYVPSQSEIDEQISALKKQNEEYKTVPGGKQLSDEQIRQIATSSGKNMGTSFLIDLDDAIIGTAFAQFVLEGKIDPNLKYYAAKALQREMLPVLNNLYPQPDQQHAQLEKRKKLLQVVRQMPS